MLINPSNPPVVFEGTNALNAAQSIGRQARIFGASTAAQVDEAFQAIGEQRFGSIYVSSDPVFFILRDKLAELAARYSLPAVYADREIAEAGGLISYGASRTDAYRQADKYAGRILHGEKVSELRSCADQIRSGSKYQVCEGDGPNGAELASCPGH